MHLIDIGANLTHDSFDRDRDAVLEQEGEWNDRAEAFADICVVCAECYCQSRARNLSAQATQARSDPATHARWPAGIPASDGPVR